ncbi:DUF664 domain-containing protein [Desertihabitans brevis]|uniref:DUF664 domain-containing protein n=1 Tax=Desertihabitans brevis TaxID=2268447 RepID=A0A367YVD6_9ACTN|nr:DUF664 domain-containing protein [Desertihabitans brevis]RCK69856.1 DUF664 domain-containing protein [Desertihabitans brevis]
MPGTVAPSTSEHTLLADYVVAQLDGIRNAGFGLTPEQLRATPTASTLSVGALMSHAHATALGWLERVEAAPGRFAGDAEYAMGDYGSDFLLADTDTAESWDARLDELGRRVRQVVPTLDLDAVVPVPDDAPWWPQGVDGWSVRWVLLHLVQEVGRHAGHADIIREGLDGATMYQLMGTREGWPASDWFVPWAPAAV